MFLVRTRLASSPFHRPTPINFPHDQPIVPRPQFALIVAGTRFPASGGYVVKTHAGSELLSAVEAVCQGKRFVSAGLARPVPVDLADVTTPNRLHQGLGTGDGRLIPI